MLIYIEGCPLSHPLGAKLTTDSNGQGLASGKMPEHKAMAVHKHQNPIPPALGRKKRQNKSPKNHRATILMVEEGTSPRVPCPIIRTIVSPSRQKREDDQTPTSQQKHPKSLNMTLMAPVTNLRFRERQDITIIAMNRLQLPSIGQAERSQQAQKNQYTNSNQQSRMNRLPRMDPPKQFSLGHRVQRNPRCGSTSRLQAVDC